MATPLSAEASQMAQLLTALTHPDTEMIRQAEKALKPLLKDPRSIPAMVEILKAQDSQPPAVRHAASILLRKRLGGHYAKFDAPTKAALKNEILQILAHEGERTVRIGIVGVAAIVGKLECGSGGTSWPELFQFIAAAAAQADNTDARELAFWILQEMTETIGLHLKPQFAEIANLFQAALQPGEAQKVQKAAVKALGQLLSYLSDEPEVEVFCQLIPPVLHVALACLHHHDEDTVVVVLDVLYDLAYSPSPMVSAHMEPMVKFGLECIVNSNLEMSVRDSAALVIATLAEAKPKTFGKQEALLGQTLEVLFGLIENSPDSAAGALFESNPAWRSDLGDAVDEDDGGLDSPTETSMAQGTLDMLACEIPKKYIYPPAMTRCLGRLSSPQPHHRKAGIAGLGVIAEGCAEPLREQLTEVIPHVLAAAGDAHPQVRECACFCLGQISEHCQPEILGFAPQILPIVFNLLDDSNVAVQATSCYVLEMFCERLEPEAVRPLLDRLVRKLAAMLEATTKQSVQEMAVAALAATAVAAEEEFAPYVEGVATLMMRMMAVEEERYFPIRGRALECMGHMAIAVGADTFRPYFATTMQCACDGLARDSTDLHEFAYAVFANLAKVMKEEFATVLPELVPHLCQVIESDEGQLEPAEAEKQAGDFTALDDSDDEGEEGGNFVLHVRTALLEAKKGAITAIGEMAAHTGANFLPHLEAVMKVLQKAAKNWHPLIKSEVAEALPSLVVPTVAAFHNGEIAWTKGDVGGASHMSPQTTAVVTAVLNELVIMMKDDDKSTVGKVCGSIQSVLEVCGPHALVPIAHDCLSNTHDILSKNAPCLTTDELYGEFPEEDDEHDVVMQAACDLVGGFCRVMGVHFKEYLPQFLPAICAYAKSSRPPNDRSMAVGCLSEIAQELEDAIFEHWHTVFFPAVVAGLADPDENVQRNAAFCAGVCCEHLRERIVDQYPQLLQSISPLFGIDTSAGGDAAAACVDNAAAAVARMIMASPSHVPLPQVLPTFLKVLPLKTDMTENDTVYTCLLGLLQMNHPDILAQKEDLRRVFAEATSDQSQVDDANKGKLRQALQALSQ